MKDNNVQISFSTNIMPNNFDWHANLHDHLCVNNWQMSCNTPWDWKHNDIEFVNKMHMESINRRSLFDLLAYTVLSQLDYNSILILSEYKTGREGRYWYIYRLTNGELEFKWEDYLSVYNCWQHKGVIPFIEDVKEKDPNISIYYGNVCFCIDHFIYDKEWEQISNEFITNKIDLSIIDCKGFLSWIRTEIDSIQNNIDREVERRNKEEADEQYARSQYKLPRRSGIYTGGIPDCVLKSMDYRDINYNLSYINR